MTAFTHPSADIDADCTLGDGVMVWNFSKVCQGATIGAGTKIGQSVYVDRGVTIGARCKIQNGVSVYHGVSIGDDVFVGPNATFTNDKVPRAHSADWQVSETCIRDGASIGANATILCGITLGQDCMVAAGAVVTRDVPDNALVAGNPARVVGKVDRAGNRVG